ncbi:MAG TPA: HAD family hydrolase [Ignavibacteria bacterium]|nr:HAD family hydrolase [Ignavibacteria bacterium]HRB00799.1 HAD family hydrolase [Ignavibacteria bacterium]
MKTGNFKVIIFDMDGVLIDSEPAYKTMNMAHFSSLGFKMNEEEYNGYVGMSSLKMWSKIKSNYGLNENVEDLMASEKERMYKVLNSDLISEPIEGIKELIDSFLKRNYRLCVASSSPKDNIKLVLKRHNLEMYFDFIVSGEEVTNGKPMPDIFLKAADHFQLSPDNCFVIEDSSNGVTAAKAAGMKCIGFRNVNSGNQDISKADLIINSFSKTEINNVLKFLYK